MWLSQKAVAAEAEIQNEQKTAPTIQELEQGISDRLKRVEEFKFIEQEATKLGVKAYLFGGTAAGYAHYVKWDLQREKSDKRFQRDRFDYDYTNIYRSTQDLDIVIDGKPEQAQALQNALQNKYPHLQGNKTAWEVRLLTQDMGDKQAILNNPDFMNQHTDSNSTGMIEITQPKNGEHVVRDVRDWTSKEPYFLKDVHDGMLHYYFSPLHETTKFAKEGRNPPIFSAIRFLTKAFQYELKIRPEDLARIKNVIDEFDPKQTAQHDYVAKWIEKNGKKLIQNAVNIEYAKNTLDHLGLRQKLQSIKGDTNVADSLAWWMNKEPLRSHPIGQGSGKTAKVLGLDIVAHETNNFLAYESITRAHTGDPNVLISRSNAAGEAAAFGDGFYTKLGKEGARGTGLTIRFHLDPNAKEGHDFDYEPKEDYVIVKNKAALKVIPESLNIGPVEYFEMLMASGESGLQRSDRGIIEKLKRRIGAKAQTLDGTQTKTILQMIHSQIDKSPEPQKSLVLNEWLSFPASTHHPEVIQALLNKKSDAIDEWLAKKVFSQPVWKDHPEFVEKIIANGNIDEAIAFHVLPQSHWKDHRKWVETLLDRGTVDRYIAEYILSKPEWSDRPDLVEKLINNGKSDQAIATYILSKPQWKNRPEWVEKLLERGTADSAIAYDVLSKPHWDKHPEWIEKLIEKGSFDRQLIKGVPTNPLWKAHPEWIDKIMERGDAYNEMAEHVLSRPEWANHPEWLETLIKRRHGIFNIIQYALPQPHWKNHPEFVEMLLQLEPYHLFIAEKILSQPHWKNHPELRRLAGGHEPTVENLRAAFARGETLHISSKACLLQHISGSLH
jgi:hypothetical protein